jgi:predicted membrane-bound mannosyltransferase
MHSLNACASVGNIQFLFNAEDTRFSLCLFSCISVVHQGVLASAWYIISGTLLVVHILLPYFLTSAWYISFLHQRGTQSSASAAL